MDGYKRRRMELLHPENALSSEEIKKRAEISQDALRIGMGVSTAFMLILMIIVAYLSTRYVGITGFWIAFIGMISDIVLGGLLAYHVGNKMSKYFTENYISHNNI